MHADQKGAAVLLRFNSIEAFSVAAGGERTYDANERHTAVICQSGAGKIHAATDAVGLQAKEGYVVSPGQPVHLSAGQEPLNGWCVRFEAYGETCENRFIRMDRYAEGWCRVEDSRQLNSYCMELEQLQTAVIPDSFRVQSLLYLLIGSLMNGQRISQGETTANAIGNTVRLMEQQPGRAWMRAELANMAGLSPGYFSYAFQRQTGKSPTTYLMDIRMDKAEELLLQGRRVKETAGEVGFEDEFYFSRRFKQKSGRSPAAFVKSRRRNIACVSDPLSGSLLALRLLPKAAALYNHHEPYSRMLRLHSCEEGKGLLWEHNLSMLRKAAPELIFCTDFLNPEAQAELGQIATVVPVSWLEADWRQQFEQLAEAVGQTDEASAWLSAYSRKAEDVYRSIRRQIGGATLNIVRVMDSHYRIYAGRNAGAVLYGDFNFMPTHHVKNREVFQTVAREELDGYDADVLLIMVDPTLRAARQWQELQGSDLWRGLTAVQNRRIYEIGTDKLFEYSAWSHDRALLHLGRLMGGQ